MSRAPSTLKTLSKSGSCTACHSFPLPRKARSPVLLVCDASGGSISTQTNQSTNLGWRSPAGNPPPPRQRRARQLPPATHLAVLLSLWSSRGSERRAGGSGVGSPVPRLRSEISSRFQEGFGRDWPRAASEAWEGGGSSGPHLDPRALNVKVPCLAWAWATLPSEELRRRTGWGERRTPGGFSRRPAELARKLSAAQHQENRRLVRAEWSFYLRGGGGGGGNLSSWSNGWIIFSRRLLLSLSPPPPPPAFFPFPSLLPFLPALALLFCLFEVKLRVFSEVRLGGCFNRVERRWTGGGEGGGGRELL